MESIIELPIHPVLDSTEAIISSRPIFIGIPSRKLTDFFRTLNTPTPRTLGRDVPRPWRGPTYSRSEKIPRYQIPARIPIRSQADGLGLSRQGSRF